MASLDPMPKSWEPGDMSNTHIPGSGQSVLIVDRLCLAYHLLKSGSSESKFRMGCLVLLVRGPDAGDDVHDVLLIDLS